MFVSARNRNSPYSGRGRFEIQTFSHILIHNIFTTITNSYTYCRSKICLTFWMTFDRIFFSFLISFLLYIVMNFIFILTKVDCVVFVKLEVVFRKNTILICQNLRMTVLYIFYLRVRGLLSSYMYKNIFKRLILRILIEKKKIIVLFSGFTSILYSKN